MSEILFTQPYILGDTFAKLSAVLDSQLFENGCYTQQACEQIKTLCQCQHVLITNSCTSALEMAALLLDIKPGDEIIMPSYTFVSTANAFVLRGAIPVFVDIRPDTLNIDENKIEAAITKRTKAIVPVHYSGVACEMNAIMQIARDYGLFVIEDAAQALSSKYHGKPLGSFGGLATLSFHHTKNITSGLGGALLINDEQLIERAKILWQKGTNRQAFLEGTVDKYTWVDIGSSFMPNELAAALLCSQLEKIEHINTKRMDIWHAYYQALAPQAASNAYRLPTIPDGCQHNAHIFYLLLNSRADRDDFIKAMRMEKVGTAFHFVPLHLSPAGKKYAKFNAESLRYTEDCAARLVRLPLYAGLSDNQVNIVTQAARLCLTQSSRKTCATI